MDKRRLTTMLQMHQIDEKNPISGKNTGTKTTFQQKRIPLYPLI